MRARRGHGENPEKELPQRHPKGASSPSQVITEESLSFLPALEGEPRGLTHTEKTSVPGPPRQREDFFFKLVGVVG